MKDKINIHLVGNAHLDPVWLWRWQEGYAEIKATFRSALDRMNEFPEFVFTCGAASYYKWVEENDPVMFEEVRQRIEEGRWVIVGGWWVQPDCNIPCGESFVRHALYSQRYFEDKFGVMAKVGYNVDSFGHNGMLPQLLKKSGMDYYVFMRPSDHEKKLPGNLFWWESEDGSRVMVFKIPYSYGNWFKSDDHEVPAQVQKLRAEAELASKQKIDFMAFYGVGNHGGGPTIANLNIIRKLKEDWNDIHLIHSSPNKYFEEIEKQNLKLPVVKDDLQHHASGCYSAHSETKKNNRRAEHRLIAAEKFASIANYITDLSYPHDRITDAWENVLFNQFHDIMGGCSIKEAYQDAGEAYGESLHIAAKVLNASLQKISWSIDTMPIDKGFYLSKDNDWALWEMDDLGVPVVVFNPLSWEVEAPIQVNKSVKGITDEVGQPLQIQKVRGAQTNGNDKWDTLFVGKLPAMGYRTYWIYKEKYLEKFPYENFITVSDAAMENDWIRLEIEPHTGYITRLFDKKNNVEVFQGTGAVPMVIDEYDSDTWAHGIFEFRREIAKFSDAKVSIIENGPVRARIRVTSRYNQSTLQQDFILYEGKPHVEVRAKLNWQEKHKMLKLSFPVNVDNPEATYEIPYGFIKRAVNGEEEPGQQWVDVTGEILNYDRDGETVDEDKRTYGLALLNDSKYSFDVKDNDMRMTVVRSPIYADHFGERDELCEFMDQGIQEFRYVLVPHGGNWQDADVVKKAYQLNVSPIQITETYHKGNLPQRFEGIRIVADNIVASVFKRAEDRDGYILRCYETGGQDTVTTIEIPMLNRSWNASFSKCEIKTFFIPEDPSDEVHERNLIEQV